MKAPDPSRGGTFVRDANGVLVEYRPPTRPTADAVDPQWTPRKQPASAPESKPAQPSRRERGRQE